MSAEVYRYCFDPSIAFEDVEASLLLAIMATESLHGEARTRLDAAHAVDAEKHTCVVDASTPVGRDLSRLLAGFLAREFGPDAFEVHRVDADSAPSKEGRAV